MRNEKMVRQSGSDSLPEPAFIAYLFNKHDSCQSFQNLITGRCICDVAAYLREARTSGVKFTDKQVRSHVARRNPGAGG